MTKPDVAAALRSMADSLRKLKGMAAWAELVVSQRRPRIAPSFRMDRGIRQDFRAEKGHFIKTSMEIKEVLMGKRKPDASHSTVRRWQRQLRKLEAEFQRLDLPTDL